ncbi:anaerobic sulfite reductase subunit AsrA [Desulfoscipio gibsoniae]|uniref:Sulfite reductase, subunit A n=1 Tax=Desulfoscipio gibsoniae DSM 7213 TaxID=767817 RepID=R4KHU3_9FIRM|nr:anaerobic sulfite reductase subunit AsrA [Desulfoscipio gibsoniae]AGL02184.1 sulfite reductase, subunit A [Desulfoscipio gibsoniae DSM 7213]
MGYKIQIEDFNAILRELRRVYRVFAPVNMKGKGPYAGTDLVGYAEISKFEQVVYNQKTVYSAKEALFKPVETLFYFTEEEFKQPAIQTNKILIFVRPCDINAFKRLDEIFINNGPYKDNYYQQRREKVKFILMECGAGFDNCFCVAMGTNATDDYSLLLRPAEGFVACQIKDPEFDAYFNGFNDSMEITPRFVEKNNITIQLPQNMDIDNDILNNPLWQEYTLRCTGCGRCNFVCPTCSCFTMQDIFYRDNDNSGERRRVWASCMVDGFTDMAGGHAFRNNQGDRMRFKVMHKFYDFHKRFGYHMCVGCGRCDDICPEYISIVKCVNKLKSSSPGGE